MTAIFGESINSFGPTIGGALDGLTLPASNLGVDLAAVGGYVAFLQARRGVVGSSGTTTIVLEINGATIPAATLSWTPVDAAYALKTVSFTPVAIVAGDRISLRLTSAEVGAEDVFAEIH